VAQTKNIVYNEVLIDVYNDLMYIGM
jgi:hypothetical protein